MLDNTIYANDAYAQELLANTAKIAAENTTDPVSICPAYGLLEDAVKSSVASALVGPGGTGKSVAVALLANRLGIPLIIFQATVETRASSLIGRWAPNPNKGVNGDDREYTFEKGLLLTAYERGYWFDCEEYLQFAPEQQSLMMKFLDGSPSFFLDATKEVVKKHPNFRFIGTGNPDYNGNKDKQKNESFLDRIKPVIYIPELAAKAIVSMCLKRYPQYNKTDFFKTAFDLNKALAASAKALLRKELVFGTRSVNAMCEVIGVRNGAPLTKDAFKLVVESTFGSAIAQVGGGCKCLPDIFADPSICGHVDEMFNEYKKTVSDPASNGTDAASPASTFKTSSGIAGSPEEIYEALKASGVTL